MNDIQKEIIFDTLEEPDLELVRGWRNSEQVSKYMYTDKNITKEHQISWFKNVSNDKTKKNWLINVNDKKVGLVSLYNINLQSKTCYWAFYIADNSIRGMGIGSKVEFKILEEVFEKMEFNKLLCEVFVSNIKVIQMHEKFGFRREAYFREHIYKNNDYHDIVSLAILKKEWESIKEYQRTKIYG